MSQTLRLATKSKTAFNSLKTTQILAQTPSANYSSMNFAKSMMMNTQMNQLKFGLT